MLPLRSNPSTSRFALPKGPWAQQRVDTFFNASGPNYAFIRDRQGRLVHHTGLDINRGYGDQDLGDLTYATHDGQVVFVGFMPVGFGRYVVIQHDGGIPLWERQAHLSEVLVYKGDRVVRGQPVGRVGKSGGQKSAHLHFDYFYVDPALLNGGYSNWPGFDEQALLKAYTDPIRVWEKWGVVDPITLQATNPGQGAA